MKRHKISKKISLLERGFTLVEILLSVTVIGILAGVVITTVNQQTQRERAADAVRLSQLEQANQAIEAFEAIEGYFPAESGGVPSDPNLDEYIVSWPAGVEYRVDTVNDEFATYVQQSDQNFRKFSTAWEGAFHCDPTNIDVIDVCVTPGGTAPSVVSLSATPSPISMTVGDTQQLTVTATYSDGAVVDVSSSSSYTSSVSGVITISSAGLITATGAGNTTLTASFSGLSATVPVTVAAATPVVTGLTLTPTSATLNVGATQQFTATATYSDGSSSNVNSSASWTILYISGTNVASVNSTGLVTAQNAGTATLRATYSGYNASASITVNTPSATMTGLTVSPTSAVLDVGERQQLTAVATYSDGSLRIVSDMASWTVQQLGSVVSVDTRGLVTGLAVGNARVFATYGGFSNSSFITVQSLVAPSVTSLTVTPASATIGIGETVQLRALAVYSNGLTVDVTNQAVWLAAPSRLGGSVLVSRSGVVTGVSPGLVTVTASYSNQFGSSSIRVTTLVTQ